MFYFMPSVYVHAYYNLYNTNSLCREDCIVIVSEYNINTHIHNIVCYLIIK